MMRVKLPVIVSIATIPSRIGHLRATLDSLLNGSLVPDQILVVHPEFCEWEGSTYVIPDFLMDEDYCRGIVKRVQSNKDWGPGTKILGAVDHIPDECYLILADDDVSYDPSFLKGLVEAQENDRNSSYSYYTYRAGGLSFGQGCDGYSFYSPNLVGIMSFAEKHVSGTTLLYHDDLWIGFFLFKQSVAVKSISNPVKDRLVYTQLLPNDVLSVPMSDHLTRHRIFDEHLGRLIREGELTRHQRLLCRLSQFRDHTNTLKMKALRRVGGILGWQKS